MVLTTAREAIKVWDVRARSIIYEIATGNDEVQSMVWDGERDVLYASVSCPNKSRMGYFEDYRKAKIPAQHQIPGEEWEEEEEG